MNGLNRGNKAAFADYVYSLIDVICLADRAGSLNDYCLRLMLPVVRNKAQSPWQPPELLPVGEADHVRVFCPEGKARWRLLEPAA
jgi:SRSO17 transposase